MARVNVEQKALTDLRFSVLGSHLSPLTSAPQDLVETAFGMFLMVKVWNYCLERGLLAVPARDLDALYPGLADAMIDADLGAKVPRSRAALVRIKGGEGRLDWLEQARIIGRENGQKGAVHGVKGGRPPKQTKPPVGVSENGSGGLLENPLPTLPLSLSLTPDPKPKTEEKNPAKTPATATKTKSPPREPDSVHFEFIRIFEDAWFCKYESKYPFVGGKDGSAVKWFRGQVGDDVIRFREVVRSYFEDCSQFIIDARHPMGNLRAQWARWAVKAPAGTVQKSGSLGEQFVANATTFLNNEKAP